MSGLPPDPWKVLGVDKSADKPEIRSAYKKLVLKCHPDKVQDPTLKAQKQDEFQKVQSAYELLVNDVERTKYEDQVKLMEIRKQMAAKSMPNSSASRTPPRNEIRTADHRHKNSSGTSNGKVYPSYKSAHSRSHEEMPSRGFSFDDERHMPRRPASYETAPKRDDERREKDERRRTTRREEVRRDELRRDDDDPLMRDPRDSREFRESQIREKEREIREREARREQRKKHEMDKKSGDKERRRDQEDKSRRQHKHPYVEPYEHVVPEEYPPSSKSEKKRSTSKKPYEQPRERSDRDGERSASRPAVVPAPAPAPPPPQVETVLPPAQKFHDDLNSAASYIERSKRTVPVVAYRSVQDSFYPTAPTPPPADALEDGIHRASIRAAAGRRGSHEGSRSREKLHPPHKLVEIDSASPKGRPVPSLSKSHSNPPLAPAVPESPPRGVSRSNTTPLADYGAQVPPTFHRTATWAGDNRHPEYYEEESEDDRDRRHRSRRSRKSAVEAIPILRYKTSDHKVTMLDQQQYAYGESPTSRRAYPDAYDSHSPTAASAYPQQFRVREGRQFTPADVKFSDAPYVVAREFYSVPA